MGFGITPGPLKDDSDPIVPGRPDRGPGRGAPSVPPNRPPTPRSGANYSAMGFSLPTALYALEAPEGIAEKRAYTEAALADAAEQFVPPLRIYLQK